MELALHDDTNGLCLYNTGSSSPVQLALLYIMVSSAWAVDEWANFSQLVYENWSKVMTNYQVGKRSHELTS